MDAHVTIPQSLRQALPPDCVSTADLDLYGSDVCYTSPFLPAAVDMRGLARIVEVNAADRYVTVQAGVTWEALATALGGTGLRTPFWGTFSGKYATVGATLLQGGKFFGSGDRGISAETVLGLRVVTGEGAAVVTGSAATPHAPSPFWRNYGPDLTGIFLADTGAFGIKTEATLQLIPSRAKSRSRRSRSIVRRTSTSTTSIPSTSSACRSTRPTRW